MLKHFHFKQVSIALFNVKWFHVLQCITNNSIKTSVMCSYTVK